MSQNFKTVLRYKGDFFNIPIANYSFNPGDYVETKDGEKGYIKTIVNSKFPEFQNINIDFGEKGQSIYTFYIYSDTERLARNFNRIGVYDFTKSTNESNTNTGANIVKVKKIEPLEVKTAVDYCNKELMWKKINELVKAVNELSTSHTNNKDKD